MSANVLEWEPELALFVPDVLHKRFIVFELDNISENRTLLPVVTIIIMETFLAKMRRLQGVRKVLLLEEAWKAIAKEGTPLYRSTSLQVRTGRGIQPQDHRMETLL